MKRSVLIVSGMIVALSLAPHAAKAFSTVSQSYSGGGRQSNIVDPDAVLEQQTSGNGTVGGDRNSGFSFGFSGGGGVSAGNNSPSFPGVANHMTPTDNARALQYGVSPLNSDR